MHRLSVIILIWIFIAILAFISGYYTNISFLTITGKTSNNERATFANSYFDYRYLNPLVECMANKHMRMEELSAFNPIITAYIDSCMAKNPTIKVSYYFRDLNNGMWIGYREKELFSPASLMKVPCLIAVLKEAESHPEILNQKLKFTRKDFATSEEEAGYPKNEGQLYSINELLIQSIQYSDNAATDMLISFIGYPKISKVEDDLNLHIESFYNAFTNFVSINTYAGIFRILYNASYLNEIMSERALEILLDTKFENGIRAGVPTSIKVAHKYGVRDLVGVDGTRTTLQMHHFGIIYYPHKPYLLGIMTKGENSKEEKYKIIEDLSRITFDEVNTQLNSNKNLNIKLPDFIHAL